MIDIQYRLRLLLDDALKSLRAFKTELGGLGTAAPTVPTAALDKSLDQAEARIRQVATAEKTAAKEVAAAKAAAEAQQAAAAQAAARQAMDAKRAQAAEEQRLIRASAAAQRVAAREAADAQRAAQKQANIATNQARMLGPQLTDISVGLATGQSPFYVALQQGGQLIDIYGGVGKALRALMSVVTAARVLVVGLAVSFATVAYQAVQGALETDALNKSLATTGNIAGVTADSLDKSAKRISVDQKVGIGNVREALASLIDMGGFIGPTLDSAGRAAAALSKLTGKSAAEQSAAFADLTNDVSAGAAKLNQAYNFLTVEEYKHIRSLQAAGREQEAIREVLDKLAATMEQRSVPALGLLERSWNAVKQRVSEYGDLLKSIGREETPEERLLKLQIKLASMKADRADPRNQRMSGIFAAAADRDQAELEAQVEAQRQLVISDQIRDSERSATLAANQQGIKALQKEFQDSLAQVAQAGSDRILAEQQAALDARQAAIERANARGLTSATQYSLSLNTIEQQRLVAQEAALKRSLDLERGRLDDSAAPAQKNAQRAKITQVETQLVELQARLRQAAAQGRNIVDADALDRARDSAQQWAQTWQAAFTQVRQFANDNAATAAGRVTDPVARADAEAKAKVLATRQQLADLLRDLQLRISLTLAPAQKAELVKQLEALGREGSEAITNQTDAAKFVSLRTQWGELTDALAIKERQLDLQVQQGAITTEEAERRKFEARDKALPQLRELLLELRKLAATRGESNAIEGLLADLDQLQDRTSQLTTTMRASIGSGFGQLFADVASGAKTAGDAFKTFLGNVVKSALNVIGQRLGEQLANSLLPKGGGGTDWLSKGINFVAGLFHDGGVVGSGGGSRALSMSGLALATALAGAPRYHSGGISGMGLRSNEELAVLLKGEEVLTEDDPRHVRNGGRNLGGGVVVNSNVSITGAQGDSSALQRAGDDLDRRMTGAIDSWAIEQSRPGGILAK